jgi:hypothetical protein
MIARDDDRQNRTGSVDFNDGGDGDGDVNEGGDGGVINDGAETKRADLTIELDGDNRREERENSIRM